MTEFWQSRRHHQIFTEIDKRMQFPCTTIAAEIAALPAKRILRASQAACLPAASSLTPSMVSGFPVPSLLL